MFNFTCNHENVLCLVLCKLSAQWKRWARMYVCLLNTMYAHMIVCLYLNSRIFFFFFVSCYFLCYTVGFGVTYFFICISWLTSNCLYDRIRITLLLRVIASLKSFRLNWIHWHAVITSNHDYSLSLWLPCCLLAFENYAADDLHFMQFHIRVLEATQENITALLMGLEYLTNISYVDDTEVFKVCVSLSLSLSLMHMLAKFARLWYRFYHTVWLNRFAWITGIPWFWNCLRHTITLIILQ